MLGPRRTNLQIVANLWRPLTRNHRNGSASYRGRPEFEEEGVGGGGGGGGPIIGRKTSRFGRFKKNTGEEDIQGQSLKGRQVTSVKGFEAVSAAAHLRVGNGPGRGAFT